MFIYHVRLIATEKKITLISTIRKQQTHMKQPPPQNNNVQQKNDIPIDNLFTYTTTNLYFLL